MKLCFCKEHYPNCTYQHPPIFVKKGEKFSLPVVIVNQDNISSNASVAVSLSPEAGVAVGQMVQMTTASCTDLVYNVYSPHDSEQLILKIVDSDFRPYDARNVKGVCLAN